jgi:hypothetical protein
MDWIQLVQNGATVGYLTWHLPFRFQKAWNFLLTRRDLQLFKDFVLWSYLAISILDIYRSGASNFHNPIALKM